MRSRGAARLSCGVGSSASLQPLPVHEQWAHALPGREYECSQPTHVPLHTCPRRSAWTSPGPLPASHAATWPTARRARAASWATEAGVLHLPHAREQPEQNLPVVSAFLLLGPLHARDACLCWLRCRPALFHVPCSGFPRGLLCVSHPERRTFHMRCTAFPELYNFITVDQPVQSSIMRKQSRTRDATACKSQSMQLEAITLSAKSTDAVMP